MRGNDVNVTEMVLHSGRKHVHSVGSEETSGRTGEESDVEYCSGDEGGSQDNGSESSASEEQEEGHRKGYGVKGKGLVGEVKRRSTSDKREDERTEHAVDVDIRHRCALDVICALNDQLSDIQKEAVRGMLVMGAMEERVCRERQRQRTAQKDVRIYRNYVSVLLELCRVNNTIEKVVMFKRLYTFLVVSGLLFARGAGGAAWDLVHVVEDVDGVGDYNWAEAIIPVIEVRDDERRMQIRREPYGSYVRVVCCAVDKVRKKRAALAKEKEGHAVTKKVLAKLKEAVTMKTAVDDIFEFARLQELHSTDDALERPAIAEEGTNIDIFVPDVRGEVDRASPSSPVQWSDVAETIAAGESVPSE
ncbi:hypothetical protein Cgig2_015772 [Carnegiea gigantea]|uniref:Uncharacterized protein n=1 Tax=Carnegiea gigantea TaxID=171969 RepID=A0A9Q1QIQ0_9CARY|nr:hypothetical protein Cgig2_015772 [Carnegiea gigantea]